MLYIYRVVKSFTEKKLIKEQTMQHKHRKRREHYSKPKKHLKIKHISILPIYYLLISEKAIYTYFSYLQKIHQFHFLTRDVC